MKTLAAALLLALAKKEVTDKGIKDIFTAAGAKANDEEIKKVVEACKGKDLDTLVKEGLTKLGGMSGGEHHEESHDDKKGKKEDKKKKEEPKHEEEDDMELGGLF